jgi:hypothetical protein
MMGEQGGEVREKSNPEVESEVPEISVPEKTHAQNGKRSLLEVGTSSSDNI